MSAASGDRPKLKHLAESRDVYDLLEHVRVRPGMFVRGGSLRELETLLVGCRVVPRSRVEWAWRERREADGYNALLADR